MNLNTIAKISIATGVVLFATIGANFAPAQASLIDEINDLSSANPRANLRNPTVAVPEPLTISGSLAALGIGWQMKRKMNKKGS